MRHRPLVAISRNGYIVVPRSLGVWSDLGNFPRAPRVTGGALPLTRFIMGCVFVTSGSKHLKGPETRTKSGEKPDL
jgi:hypothetical protein